MLPLQSPHPDRRTARVRITGRTSRIIAATPGREDTACLSAGGVVAYYPTQIPLHHRSAWLKDGDPFGDLVAGCRKLGMRVLARTDPHAVRQDVHDAHPDWIAVDAQGNKRRHWSN